MSTSLSVGAFSLSVILSLLSHSRRSRAASSKLTRRKIHDKLAAVDDVPAITKEEVIHLREKHFLSSVSVSYKNSGALMIMGGEGSRLIDEKGHAYLDTRNNVAHVGHNRLEVVKAVTKQIQELNTNTRYLHPNAVRLAQRLSAKLPPRLEKVVFVNSGSEANDLALRMARVYTGSRNTVVVDGAYHGHTLSVLEVSPYKYECGHEFSLTMNGNYETPGSHVWKVPCPDIYRGVHAGDDAGSKYAAYVKEACNSYVENGEKVGAFIIEGGMSVAGVILPPPSYLTESVRAIRQAGGVYIADEVQTGFGRLGSSYWAFQHGGCTVVPDIVTVGKPFGNGMPLAAVITTKEIADAFEATKVEYFATFAGNPVSCAAGLCVMDIVDRDNLQDHALRVGNYIFSRFQDMKSVIELIGDVRGSGLFIGVELVRSRDTKEPAVQETSFICTRLKQHYSVLSSIDGLNDNVLVIKPPLVFSERDADIFVESFLDAVGDLAKVGHKIHSMGKTPT